LAKGWEITSAKATNTASQGVQTFRDELIALIPFLRAFSRSLCGDRDLAEDLAQDALAKARRAQRSYQPGSNLKAWLFTILRHEHLSYRRRAWRQAGWDETKAAEIPGIPNEQNWTAELSDVGRAIFELPFEQREALILVGVGGFSYEEAAQIGNVAVGTIKSRVYRARATLEERLGRNESFPSPRPASDGSTLERLLSQLPLASASTLARTA
jgi:RNA polymerase sigma-70 factor (ECF subfamily)